MTVKALDSTGIELQKNDFVTFGSLSDQRGSGQVLTVWGNGTVSVRHESKGIIKIAAHLLSKKW